MNKRSQNEIGKAYKELWDKLWYQRKLDCIANIKAGLEEMPTLDVYKGMMENIRRIEREYDFYGFEDEFEYGMNCGKMSALGWLDGQEWDFLDT